MSLITEDDQFPATVNMRRKGDDVILPKRLLEITTLPDGTVHQRLLNGVVGRFTRKADGCKVLRMRWRNAWWDVPSMRQVEEWTFDSVCETPAGDIIEPDADDSWLRLLGLV